MTATRCPCAALEWSEHQAALLRRVGGGEKPNEIPDWSNIIEELESVGRRELRACRSHLVQALLDDLKAAAWPLSRDEPHWRAEARGQRGEARAAFSPSMRQHIDVQELYREARRRLPETLDGLAPLPAADECPATLDALLAEP